MEPGCWWMSSSGAGARYRNTPETGHFLVKGSPHYVGGILEMANARLYRFWGDLTPALRTGRPQNEIKHSGKPMFDELYAEPARLEQFMDAMTGVSMANFSAFAERFDASSADARTVAELLAHIEDMFLLVVVGEVKAGKSAFINALLRADDMPALAVRLIAAPVLPGSLAVPQQRVVWRVHQPYGWFRTTFD